MFYNWKNLSSCSTDGSKHTARLRRHINDDHIKTNSKIKIIHVFEFFPHNNFTCIICATSDECSIIWCIENILFVCVTHRYWRCRKGHICVHLHSEISVQENKLCLNAETLTAYGDRYFCFYIFAILSFSWAIRIFPIVTTILLQNYGKYCQWYSKTYFQLLTSPCWCNLFKKKKKNITSSCRDLQVKAVNPSQYVLLLLLLFLHALQNVKWQMPNGYFLSFQGITVEEFMRRLCRPDVMKIDNLAINTEHKDFK